MEKGRVVVGVRVRPGAESLGGAGRNVIAGGAEFRFSRVLRSTDSQLQLFELARPLLTRATSGYNACLFAYGQTGSGKTYSMMGSDPDLAIGPQAGIIPRFCHQLFQILNNANSTVDLSYYEIYNEKIHDLLRADGIKIKTPLRVREHPVAGPYVENLSLHRILSFEDAKRLLLLGNSRRATAATLANDRSSRSHSIFELTIVSTKDDLKVRSKVSLVDLAGSERVAHNGVGGDRYREGLSINKSLLTLGKVITALSDLKKNHFIPYRESVLTWLLKENLGHNSYTVMLATVSPEKAALEETLATLRYACQAQRIINKVTINEDPQHKIIRELRIEIEKLKSQNDVNNDSSFFTKELNNTPPSVQQINADLLENQSNEVKLLRAELKRLTDNLAAAKRRTDELELHKKALINNVKAGDVSQYESDYFERLQDLLNESADKCIKPDESLILMQDIKKSIETLQRVCSVEVENRVFNSQILPLILSMKKDSIKLNNILISHMSMDL